MSGLNPELFCHAFENVFYVKELEEHSWTIAHMSSNGLTADKGERNLNVTLVELPGRDGTVGLSFVYNQPDTADTQP